MREKGRWEGVGKEGSAFSLQLINLILELWVFRISKLVGVNRVVLVYVSTDHYQQIELLYTAFDDYLFMGCFM